MTVKYCIKKLIAIKRKWRHSMKGDEFMKVADNHLLRFLEP